MENNNGNNSKNILIGVLVVLVIALGAYIGYDKFLSKDKENTDITDSNSNDTSEQDNNKNLDINKEDIENFLSLMVGDNEKSYNNIEEVADYGHSDSGDFIRIIRILLSIGEYEEDNNYFIFKDEDVKKYAKSYFGLDDFVYDDSSDNRFIYENKEYKSTLSFGLYEEGPVIHNKPVVKDFKIENNRIIVNCSIETQRYTLTETNNYEISIDVKNKEYIMGAIAKIND